MAKKDFKKSTAELFMTSPDEPVEVAPVEVIEKAPATVEKGYQIIPEYKTERLQLLLKPSTKKDLKRIAERDRISVNELINKILEDYTKGSD